MTPEERQKRIDRHKTMIEFFQDDIAWLRETDLTVGSDKAMKRGENTARMIQDQERNIEMYKGFIAKLEERGEGEG